ncbi:MAG: glycosyltransferase family 2 protein [Verrucomicrobia bacterium]|nr:glycosyltransferase family 2 protein [Verrucomicrobiota bacterium]
MPELSVVIPVYNEIQNLEPLWVELREVLEGLGRPYEVIFVNDGSTDGSEEVIKRLASKHGAVRYVSFERNCGQTAAFDAGFKAARGDIVVTMDADLQNDPHDIPALLELIGDYDLVIGWRHSRRDSAFKRFQARFARRYRQKRLGDRFHDVGCSLKASRRECLAGLTLYEGMHRFLPLLFEWEGWRVAEVKVNHRPRTTGRTKYTFFRRTREARADLCAVMWMRRRRLNYRIKEEG